MNNEIQELLLEEIDLIAGGSAIAPPGTPKASYTDSLEIPQIENNPPA